MGAQTDELNNTFCFDPKEIDYLLVSHAHIAHTGLIPKLYKEGFKGRIISTAPTKGLADILLQDSAEIQAYEIDNSRTVVPPNSLSFFDNYLTNKACPNCMYIHTFVL
jgi:metallo-beta-lactamase family protein